MIVPTFEHTARTGEEAIAAAQRLIAEFIDAVNSDETSGGTTGKYGVIVLGRDGNRRVTSVPPQVFVEITPGHRGSREGTFDPMATVLRTDDGVCAPSSVTGHSYPAGSRNGTTETGD